MSSKPDKRRKLTSEQVAMIRRAYENGEQSLRALAKQYCMSVSAIWCIAKGLTWKE